MAPFSKLLTGPKEALGADYGGRTRYLNLGKVALYQMSQIRIYSPDWDCGDSKGTRTPDLRRDRAAF